jgi:dihydropteroate synthase
VLEVYDEAHPVLEAGRFTLDLSARTRIMGILNVTPDSFSESGTYYGFDTAVAHARQMVHDGADIIDIGGESTRPGAEAVPLEEELGRVIPVIETLAGTLDVPISIDTYKPAVAERALEAGASIVNDVNGLRDPAMRTLVAERGVASIIMHMKGTPRDMQQNPVYEDVVGEVMERLDGQAEQAIEAGLAPEKIIIDPGIGFGKTLEHNLEIMRRLSEFKSLGYSLVLGTSRKSFIGTILDLPADERVEGTLATLAYGIAQGAHIVRVHDVKAAARAVRMTDAILGKRPR